MQVILECIVGSTLHGTAVQDGLEDLDLMAIAIEDSKAVIGFSSKDTWVERSKPEGVRSEAGDIDKTTYGLRKYLSLALKGNPSILLALFAPVSCMRTMHPKGVELQLLTPHIVSKGCYKPFRGYMHDQHKRLMGKQGQKRCTRPELIEKYGFDTKYASHIIRLGLQGTELLKTGRITLPLSSAHRRTCVDIRLGKYTLSEVSELISHVESDLDNAVTKSTLPERPDVQLVERWMIQAYLERWQYGKQA